MAKFIKINLVRRRIMQGLMRNVGQSRTDGVLEDPSTIKNVLICRPNDRLGNLLLITPLIQEIQSTFPNAKIDLFVRGGVAPLVFEGYDCVDRILMLPKRPFSHLPTYFGKWFSLRKKNYDLAINVESNSSSGRLSTLLTHARFKSLGETELEASVYPDAVHIAKSPIYHLRHYLEQLGLPKNNNPIPPLDLKLSDAEYAHGKELLQNLTGNSRKTICIFTFATGNKCYPKDWWANCYAKLKEQFPDCNIVEILPMHNESQIDFAAPSFYSKDVREMASFLSQVDVFIGADSGIVHLSASSGAPTVGLFWVTNINKYAPYGRGSFGVNTNDTPLEQWISRVGEVLGSARPTA
ncbi:glycosyltransferase family 9 protein [Flavobacterium caeni]|uniref:ADP-heptose:LPS heptosyltransferase n=1 Tax=Flavobacterium caeni TaxID=490189 RepID=A0A1G5E286_9FLAO|nr:glycosyltransferase family 9 protein [Flavobacterium caeni]SCY21183.1 ADP-heptose:LPS heptosyltransferase [Flavobacterium caeni]